MFTVETKEITPEAAGQRSQELLDKEILANEALDETVAAATTGPGVIDAPLGSTDTQEDAVMQALGGVESVRQESLTFAEAHIGPLVEAALADAQKDGVVINR